MLGRVATLVFSMNTSLDGYVDHTEFAPGPALFRHFVEEARGQVGAVYGRVMYDLMRYWDDDDPAWGDDEHAFAAAWRAQRKWVASRTLTSVGPNAELLTGDLGTAVRRLKDEHAGEVEVAGPALARSLVELGLVDQFRAYVHPVVLGGGTPYLSASPGPLRLVGHDRVADEVVLLTYEPDRRPG